MGKPFLSLRLKVVLPLCAVMMLSAIAMVVNTVTSIQREVNAVVAADINYSLTQLATEMAPRLQHSDLAELQAAAARAIRRPHITSITILDASGQAVLKADAPPVASPEIDPSGEIRTVIPMVVDGAIVGTIRAESSYDTAPLIYRAYLRSAAIAITALAASLIGLMLVARYLVRRMTAARKDTVAIMNGDWNVRLSEEGDGALTDTFVTINQLLDTLQAAKADLHEIETRYHSLAQYTPVGIVQLVENEPPFVNDRWLELIGLTRDEIKQVPWTKYMHPDDRDGVVTEWERCVRAKLPFGPIEYRYLHPDGSLIWVQGQAAAQVNESGTIVGYIGALTDISKRKEAEIQIRRGENRLRAIVDTLPDSVLLLDARGRCTEVLANQGNPLDDSMPLPVGPNVSELFGEHSAQVVIEAIGKTIATDETQRIEVEIRTDGVDRILELHMAPFVMSPDEEPVVVSVARDVTEKHRSAALIRDRETRLRVILNNITDGVLTISAAGIIEAVNRATEDILGYTSDEMVGQDYRFLLSQENHRESEDFLSHFLQTGATSRTILNHERVFIRRDGSECWLDTSSTVFNQRGFPRFIVTVRDLSARKAIEEQLRQSQKLEAVGKLTGGIAHDFNNILAIILGNLELAKDHTIDDGELTNILSSAISATNRGAQLIHRLLAFSRQQPLQSQAADINELVTGMTHLLGRTLGETIDVETDLAPDLWPCKIDPAMLESVLLNVCVNARDAMPSGGRISITTQNLVEVPAALEAHLSATHPYIAIEISDTGTGMSAETAERAFEPFFTTKGPDKGTGLGLSMAYGFARQSNGHIALESGIGEGTTVCLFLPRTEDKDEVEAKTAARLPALAATGETVLVVEDNEPVRQLTVTLLSNLGYRPLQSPSARHALDILGKTPKIDLLLTDIVLGGDMNGRQLAREVERLRPDIKILFMSGYTDDTVIHDGKLEKGIHLLQKPFRKAALAQKLRALLDDPLSDA